MGRTASSCTVMHGWLQRTGFDPNPPSAIGGNTDHPPPSRPNHRICRARPRTLARPELLSSKHSIDKSRNGDRSRRRPAVRNNRAHGRRDRNTPRAAAGPRSPGWRSAFCCVGRHPYRHERSMWERKSRQFRAKISGRDLPVAFCALPCCTAARAQADNRAGRNGDKFALAHLAGSRRVP